MSNWVSCSMYPQPIKRFLSLRNLTRKTYTPCLVSVPVIAWGCLCIYMMAAFTLDSACAIPPPFCRDFT